MHRTWLKIVSLTINKKREKCEIIGSHNDEMKIMTINSIKPLSVSFGVLCMLYNININTHNQIHWYTEVHALVSTHITPKIKQKKYIALPCKRDRRIDGEHLLPLSQLFATAQCILC